MKLKYAWIRWIRWITNNNLPHHQREKREMDASCYPIIYRILFIYHCIIFLLVIHLIHLIHAFFNFINKLIWNMSRKPYITIVVPIPTTTVGLGNIWYLPFEFVFYSNRTHKMRGSGGSGGSPINTCHLIKKKKKKKYSKTKLRKCMDQVDQVDHQ